MLAFLGSSMSESSKKLTILRDFTIWSISLLFEVFLTYSYRGRLLDTGRLLERGV